MGTANKGAELMLQTILAQFRSNHPSVEFAVSQRYLSRTERYKYDLQALLTDGKLGRSTLVKWLMSPAFRKEYGLVLPSDVSAVLDGSGFSYGDQWGIKIIGTASRYYEQYQKRGVPIVLLPQAFGPFTGEEMQREAKRFFNMASLIFAREETSANHIRNLGIPDDRIHTAPDFTNLLCGITTNDINLPQRYACLVPNKHMLNKTSSEQSVSYIDYFVQAVHSLEKNGITPCLLLHDAKKDRELANEIQLRLGRCPQLITHTCPRVLKGIIGKSEMLIGSRFHSLVAALSQSVPVISTSWSHKYTELLTEYGIPEYLIQPGDSPDLLSKSISRLSQSAEHDRVSALLNERSERYRSASQNTFQLVFTALGLTSHSQSNMNARG